MATWQSRPKKIVFILGMHRSGSSLLARCLVKNGFSIGKTVNKDKNWQNPHGYCENDALLHLHDKLLRSNNSTWSHYSRDKMTYSREDVGIYRRLLAQEFKGQSMILIKDPRLTPFTRFLKEVCQQIYQPYFVFLSRDRGECCKSLSKAQRIPVAKAKILYDKTQQYRGDVPECLQVDHREVIFENTSLIKKIGEFCGLSLDIDTSEMVDMKLYRVRSNN